MKLFFATACGNQAVRNISTYLRERKERWKNWSGDIMKNIQNKTAFFVNNLIKGLIPSNMTLLFLLWTNHQYVWSRLEVVWSDDLKEFAEDVGKIRNSLNILKTFFTFTPNSKSLGLTFIKLGSDGGVWNRRTYCSAPIAIAIAQQNLQKRLQVEK